MGVVIKKSSKAKKPAAKKPAKKVAAKKPVAKKPAKKVAAKKPAKKVAAKKPVVAKKPVAKKAKTEIKRVPPRITRRPTAVTKPVSPDVEAMDTAKAVEFAMSIAEEMKRSAAMADKARTGSEIKLSRRPTTRTQGKSTVKFPAADLKDFRKRLIEARAAALSGVNAMKATGFNEAEDHESDGGDGTNQTLRLQALDVDVGGDEAAAARETLALGEHRAVLADQRRTGPDEVRGGLSLGAGTVNIGGIEPCRRGADQSLAVFLLEEIFVAGGEIQDELCPGQGGLRAGRNRHPEVLA